MHPFGNRSTEESMYNNGLFLHPRPLGHVGLRNLAP